jgi:hypothetical protein
MFDERDSAAVWLLGEHGMTHYDAVGFINRQALGETRYLTRESRPRWFAGLRSEEWWLWDWTLRNDKQY